MKPVDTNITLLMPLRSYHPDYLREALNSVLQQTSAAWNLLIIVEPKDRTKFEQVLDWVLGDERITLVINRGRKLAGAFNTGMQIATTPFTAILLADDRLTLDTVAVLDAAIARHPQADFFHSSRRYINESSDFISSVYPCRAEVTLEDFRKATPIKHLLCWRRSLALRFGGMDESLNSVGPDDFDFPWTMAEQGAVFQAVPECLYHYREHDNCFRLTTGLPLTTHTREIARILRKHGISETEIETRLEQAKQTYLKQCVYNSKLNRWFDKLTGSRRKVSYRPTYK